MKTAEELYREKVTELSARLVLARLEDGVTHIDVDEALLDIEDPDLINDVYEQANADLALLADRFREGD
ncbi:MAG: hypothetical protein Tp182DCM212571_85 [Prokaryotic dsDNA virus sp.]|jgi:DNA-binding protein YbaB|nr:MAG: hypothetical protein Tp182DCM212571_85 [Prokaryotic dsDNA virus sp.]|tara:strand:+ start:222 stop:428 length:207 start_codon:yes stop_codon:yes gene_type:complete